MNTYRIAQNSGGKKLGKISVIRQYFTQIAKSSYIANYYYYYVKRLNLPKLPHRNSETFNLPKFYSTRILRYRVMWALYGSKFS